MNEGSVGYDTNEGSVGVSRDLGSEDEDDNQRDHQLVVEEKASKSAGVKAGVSGGGGGKAPAKQEGGAVESGRVRKESAKIVEAKETAKTQPAPRRAPEKLKILTMRGLREEAGAGWTGEEGGQTFLEFEVSYVDGTTAWITGLKSESNTFRALLLEFARVAFPERMFLHPWMPDFKDAVWHWGYQEHSMSEEDAGEPEEHGFAKINGVCLDHSRLSYRVV
ncbi:hypothetical protein T484DRAFT_1893808, partial [Baffinella frigidus]